MADDKPPIDNNLQAAFFGLDPPKDLPRTDFTRALISDFGVDTAREVFRRLDDLQIPAPRNGNEYLASTDGIIVFSNHNGIVLRIEKTDGNAYNSSVRASSAWVLEPLGSVKLPNACMEICPGVHYEGSDVAGRQLYWKLNSDGYHFWDERIDNMGRLPPTPLAPEGTSIVIDRMSVNELSVGADAARRALLNGISAINPLDEHLKRTLQRDNPLNFRSPVPDPKVRFADVLAEFKQMGIELTTRRSATENLTLENNPQELLYGDLRRAFQEAWPDPSASPDPAKMENFWQKVQQAKDEGKLVAGWNERPANGILNKTWAAVDRAQNYDKIPYEMGGIADDIALRTRIQETTQNLMAYGTEHDLGHMKVRMIATELPDGGKISLVDPNIGFQQKAFVFQESNGLTGIGQQYVAPYGTTAQEVAGYVKVLQHQEARGMITPDQHLAGLTEVYNILEKRTPGLKDLTFDRTSIPRMEEVVNGVAHGYNTKDIQFYVDGNRSVPDTHPVMGRLRSNGIIPEDHLGWVASPETLQVIDTQIQAIVDRGVARNEAAKAAEANGKPVPLDINLDEKPAVAVAPAATGMNLMGKINNTLDGGMGAVGLVQGTMGAIRSAKEGDAVGVVVNGANAVTGGTAVGISVARGLGQEIAPVVGSVVSKANIAVTVGTGVYQIATEKGNFIDQEADGSHNLGNKGERTVAVVATTATGLGLAAAGVGTAGVVPAVIAVAVVGDKAIEARRAWKDVDRQIAENGKPQRRDVTYKGDDGSPDFRKFRHIFTEMLEVSRDIRDSELPFKPQREPSGRIKFDDMRKLAESGDPKFMAEFERALDANIAKNEKIMAENDSILPKWMRFDDGVSRYTDAQMVLADMKGAKTELGWLQSDIAAWKVTQASKTSRFAPQQQPVSSATVSPVQPSSTTAVRSKTGPAAH